MAIIKVDTSDGIKEFQISGETPTETERERIMQIVSPTEQLGQMKSIEGAGEKFASKFDEGFDYETGADSGLRAKVSFGETDGEQEKILRDQVGVGGYTKDSYGRLALTPEGQRVRGMENISDKNIILEDEGFSFGDVADLAGLIPETAGAVIGAVLTAPGIITSAFGAAAGAAAGQYLEEGIETLLGIQQQSFGK